MLVHVRLQENWLRSLITKEEKLIQTENNFVFEWFSTRRLMVYSTKWSNDLVSANYFSTRLPNTYSAHLSVRLLIDCCRDTQGQIHKRTARLLRPLNLHEKKKSVMFKTSPKGCNASLIGEVICIYLVPFLCKWVSSQKAIQFTKIRGVMPSTDPNTVSLCHV